eukprot:TRINITY_DN207_c0_g1_i2.p1 TRINITY_DN207_c0_g1~~TRINITY_DN207_c0_g1_i2.p1  ORF type:complete len:127 (-),score=27.16 TRINITY_DN207_c0_g1_i2:49-399(-)
MSNTKLIAQTVNLKDDPELIAAYKQHHQNVWPEVIASLKAIGCHSMNIFLLGRRMFMVCQVDQDFEPSRDFPKYLDLDPKCQEWEDLMTTFQEPVPEAKEGDKWAPMEEVFDMEWF